MLTNVFLFTWEEKYLLDKELARWKETFVAKFGTESIFSFDLENLDMGMVKQSIYAWGLFVTKKMIIIQGIPYEGTTKAPKDQQEQVDLFAEELIKKEGKIPEEALLVFVSSKPDKRLKLYKFLERNATLKEFSRYKESQLKDFIISQLPGIYIPTNVVEYMLAKVGPDLYRLWFECEKLHIRCTEKNISTIDVTLVDLIVFGDVDTDAFTLLEKLFADPKWALTIIDTIKNDGEDRNKFAGMLYRSLKISIFIVDLYTNGTRDSKEIAAYIGWNPWQISKSLKQIDQLQKYAPRIHDFYRGLIDIDYGIKQWRYPDTYFWLGVKKLITNN